MIMDFKEVTDLISIRQYTANSINNHTIDKKTVNYLNNLLLLIDKKIIMILSSDQFKAYIDYENVQQVRAEAIKLNNLKSGLK
jgi:hypothetical protein